MMFSQTIGEQAGLVQDIDFICSTDSTSYPLVDKTRNINRWYYKIITDIIDVSGDWEFDDPNKTDTVPVTLNLVDDTRRVALPSSVSGSPQGTTTGGALLKLQRIEVLVTSGTIWHRLHYKNPRNINIALSEVYKTKGIPQYYYLSGEAIYLLPAPDTTIVTATNGLRIYETREIDAFLSTDTTQEPAFVENFHRILSLGSSYDWLNINSTTARANSVLQEATILRKDLKDFYSRRDEGEKTSINPKLHNYV